MEQLLRNPPLPTSPTASLYLKRPPKYFQEWWTEGGGDTEPLTLEALHVAHQLHLVPPVDAHPQHPAGAAHNAPSRESLYVAAAPTAVGTPCTKCTHSVDIARRAVVALKNCRLHLEASRQFAEWSASHSQRLSLGCKFLLEEQAKLGRPIDREDLHRLGGKDYPYGSGVPLDRQTTTYPSEDGINWALYPYEDTQGPLLSSGAPPSIHSLADVLDQTTPAHYEDCLGEEGFNIQAWSASLPLSTGILPGAARVDAGVQVPCSNHSFGLPPPIPPASAERPSPDALMAELSEDIVMHTISPTPTDISSGGLSDKSISTSDGRLTDQSSSMESEHEDFI